MTAVQLKESIAYCGLVCGLCSPDASCDCRTANHCVQRFAPGGCHQYRCCRLNNYAGCWECPVAPCGKGMLAPHKVKLRAFIRCIKEDGLDALCQYLKNGMDAGYIYHRDAVWGDYDLPTEEAVLALLRSLGGARPHKGAAARG